MAHFALIYTVRDMEKNALYRPAHVEFLSKLKDTDLVEAAWKFPDYQAGMVHSVLICKAGSKEEVLEIFSKDPVVSSGARTIEARDAEQGLFQR